MTTTTWYWEYTRGTSKKFYRLTANADTLRITMQWGRIGTAGQSKVFEARTRKDYQNTLYEIRDKRIAHGYTLIDKIVIPHPTPVAYIDVSDMAAVS